MYKGRRSMSLEEYKAVLHRSTEAKNKRNLVLLEESMERDCVDNARIETERVDRSIPPMFEKAASTPMVIPDKVTQKERFNNLE